MKKPKHITVRMEKPKRVTVNLTQELIDYIIRCSKEGKTVTPEDVSKYEHDEAERERQAVIDQEKREISAACEKMKKENVHNFRPEDILEAKIADWDAFKKIAWFNNSLNHWLISYRDNKEETSFYAEFNETECIKYDCSCYGCMCWYRFNSFFEPNEIDRMEELELQKAMLKLYNKLYDSGALVFRKNNSQKGAGDERNCIAAGTVHNIP